MSLGFMPFLLAHVKNGEEHIYEQNAYLLNEMPQDAWKRFSRMDGMFLTTVDEVGSG